MKKSFSKESCVRSYFLAAIAVTASSAVFSSAASAGEVRLVNADSTKLSELCIAAVESESRYESLVKELRLAPGDVAEVRCNGKSLQRFVTAIRAKLENPVETTVVFRTTDESDLSRLCMAVLESDEAYEKAKASIKSETGPFLDSDLLCNNMPIKSFARKYRNMTAAL